MVFFGFAVGLLVGLTGTGAGSVMTPLLVVVFGINPATAIGTDIAYSAVEKSVGGWREWRPDNVDMPLSTRMAIGSVPGAVAAGVILLRSSSANWEPTSTRSSSRCSGALLLTRAALLARVLIHARPGAALHGDRYRARLLRRAGHRRDLGRQRRTELGRPHLPLLAASKPGGRHRLVPRLDRPPAAAVAHVFAGDIDYGLAPTRLVRAIPGILLSTQISPRAPRPLGAAALGASSWARARHAPGAGVGASTSRCSRRPDRRHSGRSSQRRVVRESPAVRLPSRSRRGLRARVSASSRPRAWVAADHCPGRRWRYGGARRRAARGAGQAGRPQDPARNEGALVPVVPCGREVPKRVVVHPTLAEAPTPGKRTVRPAGSGVELSEYVNPRARIVLEDVELLVDREAPGERVRGGSGVIGHDHPLGARMRMVAEFGADHVLVCRPMVKGVGRRVEADQPAAGAYKGDQRPFPGADRELARGQQEHHGGRMSERRRSQLGGTGQEHHPVAPAAGGDGTHRGHRGRDRQMVVTERLGEDEHRRDG